jgi:hypothetical protein
MRNTGEPQGCFRRNQRFVGANIGPVAPMVAHAPLSQLRLGQEVGRVRAKHQGKRVQISLAKSRLVVIIAPHFLKVSGAYHAAGKPSMSRQKVLGYLALSWFLTSCGCGTMANIEGRRLPAPSPPGQEVSRPFGGVRRDIEWVKSLDSPGNLAYVADLPLSLIGDLVTLPKTVTGSQSDSLLQGSGPVQVAPELETETRLRATP